MGRMKWLAAGALILACAACGKKAPLLFGIVGDLPSAERVGDSGFRNGATLAVGDVNEKGGVAGRDIDLAVEDDNGDPGLVPKVDERLFAKGAVVLIGHNTSATTAAALPVVARHKRLLMGPEATSSQFAGKQDFFVRNEVREKVFAETLADYAVRTLKIHSVAAILDEKNTPYSRPFFDAFRAKMMASGGAAELVYPYENLDVEEGARQVANAMTRGSQAVLLIANGADTQKLAMAMRKIKDTMPLLSTPWSMPPSGANQLGPLPESLIFPCTWDPDSQAPAYLAFKKAYEGRFGIPVDYHAVHAYEAVTIVAQGLEATKGRPEDLPNAIATIGKFNGLQGPIQIDPYGDCTRQVYLLKVSGGVPRRVATAPGG